MLSNPRHYSSIIARVEWGISMSSSHIQNHKSGNSKTKAELAQELKDLQDQNDFLTSELRRKDEQLEDLKDNNEKAASANETLWDSEEKYHTLFDSIDEGFCTIEMIFDTGGKPVDYRFLETNKAFEKQTGLHDAIGKRMRELVPDHEEHWFEIYGDIATTGEPRRFINAAKPLMGGWYEVMRSGSADRKATRWPFFSMISPSA